jgi:hypothetical protein
VPALSLGFALRRRRCRCSPAQRLAVAAPFCPRPSLSLPDRSTDRPRLPQADDCPRRTHARHALDAPDAPLPVAATITVDGAVARLDRGLDWRALSPVAVTVMAKS